MGMNEDIFSTADNQSQWADSRDELRRALESLGYPTEFADTIAKYIGSPKGIQRMAWYVNYVRPEKTELIVDEMLAIKSEIDTWRERKESQQANAAYTQLLNCGLDTDDE
ncbi:hypothetical protein [Ruminococcus albus]|nr:hypothetical protein [Ruminococcus albus]